MVPLERINDIKRIVMSKIRRRNIRIKFHKPERSILEGIFARGDRRLGSVILEAWRGGCKFDARKRAFEQKYTPDCFDNGCPDCGACARSRHYVKAF
jgi:hypothetical protein